VTSLEWAAVLLVGRNSGGIQWENRNDPSLSCTFPRRNCVISLFLDKMTNRKPDTVLYVIYRAKGLADR
jgi:hypothetical protein